MKKSLLIFSTLLLAVGSFSSCSKDDDNDKSNSYDASNVFSSDYEEYGVGKEQQTLEFNFKSSCADVLKIVNNNKWLDVSIDNSNSAIIATVTENTGEYARVAEVTIRTKDKKHSKSIKIIQEGAIGFCTDGKHPHALDLGTGVKWACCNVGASAPWEFGGYYSWGETKEKDYFSLEAYEYYDKDDANNDGIYEYKDLGDDIAGTSYDVAHVLWKKDWKMPSKGQFEDLIKKCTTKWEEMSNGIKGRRFTSENGIYLFLPAAGNRYKDKTNSEGENVYYWSSTQADDSHAYYLVYFSGILQLKYTLRYDGLSIRPVMN